MQELVIDQELLKTLPAAVFSKIFKQVIPVKVEYEYEHNWFVVIGYCEQFESIEVGSQVPNYSCVIRMISRPNGKAYRINFKLIEG